MTTGPGARLRDAKALHSHVRLPDERIRFGQDGRRARRGRRLHAHGSPRGRRRHSVQHLLGAREGAGARVPRSRPRPRAEGRESPGSSSASAAASPARKARRSCGRAPYVDVVFGPQTLHRLPALIRERRATGIPQVDVSFPAVEKFDHLPPPRVDGSSAFVSIMEGCSKYCTFCVVPYTRGDEVSRPFDDVLTEVADLADQGVVEVTLLGQNVNAYRGPDGRLRRARRPRHAAAAHRGDSRHRAHPLHDVAPEGDDVAAHRRLRERSTSSSPTCTCRCSRARTACSRR